MKFNLKWNRKYSCVLAGTLAVAVIGSGIGYRVIAAGEEQTDKAGNDEVQSEEASDSALRFTEEGTTQIKTESQSIDFAVGAVTVTVEEVYAEAGQMVAEGDALFKISDDSLAELKNYYEEAIEDANETLEDAKLSLTNGALEAELNLQSAEASGESAQSSYDAAISELTMNVQDKKDAFEEAWDQIGSYQSAIDDGTYYVQVGIDEKQAAIDTATATVSETQTALVNAQNSYDAAQATFTTDIAELKNKIAANASYEELAALSSQIEADYTAALIAQQTLSQSQIAADTAQSNLEKANLVFENALKEYDQLVKTANERITELAGQVDELQASYEQAERDAVTAESSIQKEYEEAVLTGKYAGTEYESTLAELADAVETAETALVDLQEEQAALLALEDGKICADRAGTLASITYDAEDTMINGVAVASYYDTSMIYISVEVAQEQIALLTVGDEVDVSVSGSRGALTGTVASIATEKTSGRSISNVTYAVVIEIDNEQGMLSSGSSATVVFDYEEDVVEGAE